MLGLTSYRLVERLGLSSRASMEVSAWEQKITDITMVRVFANGPGNLCSIPSRVIPKTQKWYLMPPCLTLSIIRDGSRVKWGNPGKRVAPSPKHWCSSYRKGCLRVTLDYSRQLYYLLSKAGIRPLGWGAS